MPIYRKRDLREASESDCKEILTTQATLERLKKEGIQSATRQKKLRDERKRKLESMDEATHKKLMGKTKPDLGQQEKCDESELIKEICRIAISGSAGKTLDQLTKALNHEGFELKRSSVYFHLLPKTLEQLKEKGMWQLPLLSFTNLKIQSVLRIHQQSFLVHQSDH